MKRPTTPPALQKKMAFTVFFFDFSSLPSTLPTHTCMAYAQSEHLTLD